MKDQNTAVTEVLEKTREELYNEAIKPQLEFLDCLEKLIDLDKESAKVLLKKYREVLILTR